MFNFCPVNASQSTVFSNGKPILVRGDRLATHFIKFGLKCINHPAKLSGQFEVCVCGRHRCGKERRQGGPRSNDRSVFRRVRRITP